MVKSVSLKLSSLLHWDQILLFAGVAAWSASNGRQICMLETMDTLKWLIYSWDRKQRFLMEFARTSWAVTALPLPRDSLFSLSLSLSLSRDSLSLVTLSSLSLSRDSLFSLSILWLSLSWLSVPLSLLGKYLAALHAGDTGYAQVADLFPRSQAAMPGGVNGDAGDTGQA